MFSLRLLPCILLLATMSGACLILGSDDPVKADGETLTVVSYNIRNGGRRLDGQYDRPLQRRVLRDLKPDLVALEEVDHFSGRAGKTNVVREFADDLGMTSLFAGAIPFDGGFYGTAALSRLPVLQDEALPLPVMGAEARCVALRMVKLNSGAEIAFFALHLDSDDSDARRVAGIKTLLPRLEHLTIPIIIAGDFNDTPDSACVALLLKAGFRLAQPKGDARSFPADTPVRAIDHLLVRDGDEYTLTDTGTEIVSEPLSSDHRPLCAHLRVMPKVR